MGELQLNAGNVLMLADTKGLGHTILSAAAFAALANREALTIITNSPEKWQELGLQDYVIALEQTRVGQFGVWLIDLQPTPEQTEILVAKARNATGTMLVICPEDIDTRSALFEHANGCLLTTQTTPFLNIIGERTRDWERAFVDPLFQRDFHSWQPQRDDCMYIELIYGQPTWQTLSPPRKPQLQQKQLVLN